MANVFLKNTATKWQSNAIDLHSAYIVLSAQTVDQIKNWQIFVDDSGEKWVNILDCALMVDLLKAGGEVTAPVTVETAAPQLTEAIEIPQEFFNPESHQSLSNEELAQSILGDEKAEIVQTPEVTEESSYPNKRMHPRFSIRLRVIIKSGKNTFLTYTNDVSLGGLSLVNDVPEYIFNSEVEIYITAPDNKNNLKLICLPVASKLGKSRLMFTNVEEVKQKVLATWLHHVVKPNADQVIRSS